MEQQQLIEKLNAIEIIPRDTKDGYLIMRNLASEFPEIFPYNLEGTQSVDNYRVADELKEADLIPNGAKLDPEAGCFFIYFPDLELATKFLADLRGYIRGKYDSLNG